MQAAFYVKQGPAREVLQVGEQPTPEPGPGEVRVHLKTSGANPSDWKSRSGRTASMSTPLIIPHSDGAGDIDRVGPGVTNRIGERVWVWNGQWRRPHGTAAEYIVLPSAQAVTLPEHIGRSLLRHPSTHCPSSSAPRRAQASLDCDDCRRRWFSRTLRYPVREDARRTCHYHCQRT